MSDELTLNYELLDLEPILIPPRSYLFCLEPIGVGLSTVESLTNYISRLAIEHSIYPRTLIAREILFRFSKDYLLNSGAVSSFWGKQAKILNGTEGWTQNCVRIIEELTLRNDIRFLTMITWREVVSSRGLLRTSKAWCSACYADWYGSGQLIYNPLIWNFSAVTICPHHLCYLNSQCPHCGHSQPLIAPRVQNDHCHYCKGQLGSSLPTGDNIVEDETEFEWQNYVVTTIGELLSIAPSLSTAPRKENIRVSINHCIEKGSSGNVNTFAREVGLSHTTVQDIRAGLATPTLSTLLKICYYFNISLQCLLKAELPDINLSKVRSLPETQMKQGKKNYRVVDFVKLQMDLEAVLQCEDVPPPSMKKVADKLGYDQSYLYSRFPTHCSRISARFLNYTKKRGELRREKVFEDVRQATIEVFSQGIYPGCDQVSKNLEPGIMREKIAMKAWRETLSELGLRNE